MNAPKFEIRYWKGVAAAGAVLALVLMVFGPGTYVSEGLLSTSTSEVTYDGRAVGMGTAVPLVGTVFYADTGSLPDAGGVLFADFTKVDSDVAKGTVFLSYTRGFLDVAMSEATTSDVVLLPGSLVEVVAGFTYARTVATPDGVAAASEVVGLTVGGVAVDVTGQPNQVYEVPGALKLVINEQSSAVSDGSHSVTAIALHAHDLVTGTEIIVSGATSKVEASDGGSLLSLVTAMASVSALTGHHPKAEDDFVTGGGFFVPPNSNRPGKVNFGFNAGPRPGNSDLKGKLNLIDHATGLHVQGRTVDSYVKTGDETVCRMWSGDARVNNQDGYRFRAAVCDYGEPGRNDRFVIEVTLSGVVVYFADNFDGSPAPHGGELDGGNIQLHPFRR